MVFALLKVNDTRRLALQYPNSKIVNQTLQKVQCLCLFAIFVKRWTNYLFSNGCCFIEESTLIDYCKLIAAVGIAVPYTVNPILQKVQCMFHNNVLFVLVCNFL